MFGGEMLWNTENIALRSLQILYKFVLRAEKVTIFELKFRGKGDFFRAYQIYTKLANLASLYFP